MARLFILAAFLAVSVFRPAMAVEPAAAETLVRALVADAGAAITGSPLSVAEKRARLGGLVDKYADIAYEAELLIGRHWRNADAEGRKAFTSLLIPFVVATYGEMVDAAKVKPEVAFDGSEVTEKGVVVHTRLLTPGAEPVVVDWLVAETPSGKTAVVDLVADGISMVTTIRADFTAVIRAGGGGLESLLAAMRRKIEAVPAAR